MPAPSAAAARESQAGLCQVVLSSRALKTPLGEEAEGQGGSLGWQCLNPWDWRTMRCDSFGTVERTRESSDPTPKVSKGRGQSQGRGQVSAAGQRESLVPEAAFGGKVGVPAGLALSGIFSIPLVSPRHCTKAKCHSCYRILAVPSPSWFPSACSFFSLLLLNMSCLLCLLTIRALPFYRKRAQGTGPTSHTLRPCQAQWGQH